MLESYATRRYASCADRALLAEEQGQADVSWPGRGTYASPIAVYVGPDGARFLACDPPPGALGSEELRVEGVQVRGTLADGRSIVADDCSPTFITSQTTGAGTNTILVLRVGGPELALVATRVVAGPLRVEWTLINALFEGIDWSPKEDGTGRRCDSFRFATSKHVWRLHWHPRLDEVADTNDLKVGAVRALPTAILSTDIPDMASLEEAEREAYAITRLLSLASGASVGGVSRRVVRADTLVGESYMEWAMFGGSEGYEEFALIQNHAFLPTALRDFLGQCVESYLAQEKDLALSVVIGYLEQARSNRIIDIRLALTIFALEALTHRLCLLDGMTEQQLENQSIEQKLNRLRGRRRMGFIDKRFAGDARKNVRNPLLHTGQIPSLTMPEKVEWFGDLYALAFKMLLFLLGYRGKWLDLSRAYAPVDSPR